MNFSNRFLVKTPKQNARAVYDLYRKGENGPEYRLFLDKDEVKGHPDLNIITDIVDQLLQPKRIITFPGEIPVIRGFNKGFFRDETPKKDIKKEMKGCDNLVGIPGKNKDTGLRLLCLQWDYATIVLMNGYDKKGWLGSFQENLRLMKVVSPFLKIFEVIYDAINFWQDYRVNTCDVGFIKNGEAARCEEVDLQRYME